MVIAPTGNGAEAFTDAEDIAAVAAATLINPVAHAGEHYTLTGPTALRFAEVAEVITEVTGAKVSHLDIERST